MENVAPPLSPSPLATGGKGWLLVMVPLRFGSPPSTKLGSSPFSSFLHFSSTFSVSLLSPRFLHVSTLSFFPFHDERERTPVSRRDR